MSRQQINKKRKENFQYYKYRFFNRFDLCFPFSNNELFEGNTKLKVSRIERKCIIEFNLFLLFHHNRTRMKFIFIFKN